MVGVGNVGAFLNKYEDGNLYLSRDAGRSWKEIAKGPHLYEFGDRGGIIVIVNDGVATDRAKFSLDQGSTFAEVKLSDHIGGGKIKFSHIVTESYESSSDFVLFGTVTGGLSHDKKSVAIHLDFDKIWSRTCDLKKDDPAKSDYEVWSPSGSDDGEERCIFCVQVNPSFSINFVVFYSNI